MESADTFLRPDATGLAPKRDDGTRVRYSKVAATVARMATRDLGHKPTLRAAAQWLVAQHGRYKHNTFRQYRAGLRELVEAQVTAGSMSPEQAHQIDLILGQKPIFTTRRRTSSRKRISVGEGEIDRVLDRLSTSGSRFEVFTGLYVFYGITFFLRPIEWSRARVENDNLVIMNAKATNGRGTGKERTILLERLYDFEVIKLDCFLAELQLTMDAAGGWPTLARRLAKTIRRACKAVGVRPFAPYSLRHVGISTAKLQFAVEFVAALAGQASDRTASSSYAKARTGLPGWRQNIEPDAGTLALVRRTGRYRRRSTSEMTPAR